MTRFDWTPLFRSSVGFDRMQKLLEAANARNDSAEGFPPYNINQLSEDTYRISLAVAGFHRDELDIEVREGRLEITGRKAEPEKDAVYLHQGITGRSFKRTFQLAEYVNVTSANLSDGLLHVDLLREIPEEAKPRTIEIRSGAVDTPSGVRGGVVVGEIGKRATA